MNTPSLFTAVAMTAAMAAGSAQASDVGVSIAFSQPGVYGRVDIGRYPPPVAYGPRPVWGYAPRVVPVQPPQPVYLWVPPGHRVNWHQHCARYQACGVPVMFVQDRWYHQHVARAPGRHHDEPDRGRGHGRGHRD